jgi:hypothetical protein
MSYSTYQKIVLKGYIVPELAERVDHIYDIGFWGHPYIVAYGQIATQHQFKINSVDGGPSSVTYKVGKC